MQEGQKLCASPALWDKWDLDAQEVRMIFAVLEHALTLSHGPSPYATLYITACSLTYVVKLQTNASAPDPSG